MNKTAARGSSPGKVASPSPPPSAATVPDGFEHQQIPENLHRLQLLLVDQVDGQWFAFDPPSGNITFISEQRAADLHRVRNSSAGEGDGELRAALVEQLSYAPVPTTPSDPDRSGVSLSLHLNHGCNLACTYCYADGRISDGEGTAKGTYGGKVSWMPPEIVARSIEKLAEATTSDQKLAVTMFGGEPLLSERRFIEAMAVVDEQARRFGRQVRVVVVTNGTKITPTLIECFKKHDCHVNVSMDGDRETHNRQRPFGSGKPSYDALLDGIRQLSEGGIRFGVRMTAIRGESDLISGHQAMAATAAESVGICFNVYGEDATRPLRGTEYEQLLAFYRDIARRVLRGDPAAVKLATVQKQLLGITIGRRRSFNCGAGRWGWTVAPDGEAFPCHRFAGISAFSLGRVTDEGFRFRSHPMFEADAVENRLVCRDGRPGCAQCYARFLCGGGCAQIGFVNTGLISEMPTFYCKEQRLRVRAIVGALAEVLVVKHRRGEAGDQTDSDSDD